ncbi:peptidoglycan-binding protein [Actinomadura yumaensis]|uniref:Peptidoglycan-binding protein n=1 Tax=Actinomadura yumaensis TaxID=111807 RepID=A0ABW2CS58_9ACTN
MGTVKGMLAQARATLGMGEPNKIQSWYRARNGSAYGGNFAWCDAAVTFWARHSDNAAAVLPHGDRAYTVYHARDFQNAGRWFAGTTANVNKARPGDIVFFDWGGSDSVGAIDHVGIVEKALGGGRVQTIEGNTGDACKRRVRGASVIAGYGRPAYTGTGGGGGGKPSKPAGKAPAFSGRILRLRSPMMSGADVRTWQTQMRRRGWHLAVDGVYGPDSAKTARAFQAEKGLAVDGQVGPATWAAAWTAPIT